MSASDFVALVARLAGLATLVPALFLAVLWSRPRRGSGPWCLSEMEPPSLGTNVSYQAAQVGSQHHPLSISTSTPGGLSPAGPPRITKFQSIPGAGPARIMLCHLCVSHASQAWRPQCSRGLRAEELLPDRAGWAPAGPAQGGSQQEVLGTAWILLGLSQVVGAQAPQLGRRRRSALPWGADKSWDWRWWLPLPPSLCKNRRRR